MLKSKELKSQLVAKSAEIDTLSDPEQRAKAVGDLIRLGKDYVGTLAEESEQRSALEGADPETLEKQSLLKRARVGDFIKALLNHAPVQGAAREVREAFCGSGAAEHEVPLELFEPADKQKAVTPAPATGSRPQTVGPVQPFIYERTVAGHLGIDLPMVSGGEQAFPVLSTATPSAPKAKDAAADNKAAAITVHKSNVKRITGQYIVRVEDMSQFPELEPSLRRDIPRSIANNLDSQLLSGSGTDPELKSLFSLLTNPTANTTKETFETFISSITGLVDGLHANELTDLFALVGMKTYEVMTSTFRDNTAITSADYLTDRIGSLRTSNRIAKPSSDDQQAIVRLGMEPMCAVAPVWGGVQLVDDPYSLAGKGQRQITAYQLVSDVLLLRPDAFKQIDFHLA